MKQYLDLLETIKAKGTLKPAAREGMPGTISLFGYQFRHDLKDGFPLLTTKKMFWKGIVVELIWFLRGDTNIKYLYDNGVHIWDEDAYNYYLKLCKNVNEPPMGFVGFQASIEVGDLTGWKNMPKGYKLGDCGHQYGKVWRDFNGTDQIRNIIKQLRTNPESRRHIVTAIDPSHENDLALYWCHAMFQFNCRPLTDSERTVLYYELPEHENIGFRHMGEPLILTEQEKALLDSNNIPKYYLDCQLYQRSADVFLGVPFNIASYALLTHIMAKLCNMIPGEFVHTFGDVHIYENHMAQVDEQLKRTPTKLPDIDLVDTFNKDTDLDMVLNGIKDNGWKDKFYLLDYSPQESIKAELSTGLKKKL